jgi:GNAT superfamily N-acetyltransferase
LATYEKLADRVTGSAEALERWLFDEQLLYGLVKVAGVEIVGYALYFRNFSTFRTDPGLWLEDLYVKEECRGRGYGKELLAAFIEEGKRLECGRAEWCVLDWNEPAIQFYQAMGATVIKDWRLCRYDLKRY